MRNFLERLKHKLQRIFRGYSDSDIYNLDDTIVRFVKPKIKKFREDAENTGIYPACLNDINEWLVILDKIVFAFDNYDTESDVYWDLKNTHGDNLSETGNLVYIELFNEFKDKMTEGFELFGRWMYHLWI